MRRVFFALLASLTVLPVACSSSTNPAPLPAGAGLDAGAPDATVPDAPVSENTPDAAAGDSAVPNDSSTDAPIEAAPTNTATITVLKAGAPEAGVTVVFQDAAGAIVETKTTGADGKASRVVVAGSLVTVVTGGPGARELFTFVGVKPGDALTVIDGAGVTPVVRNVSITTPANPPGGSVSLILGTPNCGTNAISPTAPLLIDLTPDCWNGIAFPVLNLSFPGNGTTAFSFKKGNPAAATSVSGFPAWSTATGTYALDLTNVPPTILDARLSLIADGAPYAVGKSINPIGTTGAASFVTIPGYAEGIQAEAASTLIGNSGSRSLTVLAQRVAETSTALSLDLSKLLPNLTATAIDATTAERPLVTLTSSAPTTGTDAGAVRLSWSRTLDGSSDSYRWTLLVPPGTTTVKCPALPASAAAWVPGDEENIDISAAFFESDQVTGYDQVRPAAGALGFTEIPASFVGPDTPMAPTLPAPGTVRVTMIEPLPPG